MRLDVSLGRWKREAQSPALSLVKVAPGWWRVELGPLAIEIDDEPPSLGQLVVAVVGFLITGGLVL